MPPQPQPGLLSTVLSLTSPKSTSLVRTQQQWSTPLAGNSGHCATRQFGSRTSYSAPECCAWNEGPCPFSCDRGRMGHLSLPLSPYVPVRNLRLNEALDVLVHEKMLLGLRSSNLQRKCPMCSCDRAQASRDTRGRQHGPLSNSQALHLLKRIGGPLPNLRVTAWWTEWSLSASKVGGHLHQEKSKC
jgi:hypothetical protein